LRLTSQDDRWAAAALNATRVMDGIYAGRLVVCLGVYGSALLFGDLWEGVGGGLSSRIGFVAIAGLLMAALFTPLSYVHTHLRRRPVSRRFVVSQAVLDVALITGIVHITGGLESRFPPLLYIALVTAYALVLPFTSTLLVAFAGGVAYLGDVALAYSGQLSGTLFLQIVIFATVALVSALIVERLRRLGHELRTVESEMQRLRLDTADILREIPSGVITMDGAGNVAYMNPAAARLLDVELESWIGRDLLVELDERAPGVASSIRETLASRRRVQNREALVFPHQGGVPTHPELAIGTPVDDRDEQPPAGLPVAVSTSLLIPEDAPPSLTLLLQDLRIVRQVEELRVRAGKLEAVAELSASLAHELKNPLASVRSAVEQLCNREEVDPEDRTLGRLILRESDRLDCVLSEFSDFAGVNVAQRKMVSTEELIRGVVEVVRRHPAADRRARFVVRIEHGLEGLWGDPDLLHRALFNLVLNAVQVGDPDRSVTVRIVADSLHPDTVPPETALGLPVRIRVIDDGPGIAPEDLPNIFDPFYTRRRQGSGLGLSIAHRAVQAHGGALLVSSVLGQGATFIMVLPRRARGDLREKIGRTEAGGEIAH